MSPGNYSRLMCEVQLVRSMGYYLIQIYIPAMLIVIISWVSFWLHRNASPARVQLGVLTVLTMTTLMSSTNSQLPKISYVKSIDVFLGTCFVMVFAALLEYAAVGYIGKRISMRKNRFQQLAKAADEKRRRLYEVEAAIGHRYRSCDDLDAPPPPPPPNVAHYATIRRHVASGERGPERCPGPPGQMPQPVPTTPGAQPRTPGHSHHHHGGSVHGNHTRGPQVSLLNLQNTMPLQNSTAVVSVNHLGQLSLVSGHAMHANSNQINTNTMTMTTTTLPSHKTMANHDSHHVHVLPQEVRLDMVGSKTTASVAQAMPSPGGDLDALSPGSLTPRSPFTGQAANLAHQGTPLIAHGPGTPKAPLPKNLNELFGVSPSDIDKYSRVVFPVCFVCFNLMYWMIYLHISKILDDDTELTDKS